MSCLTGKIAAAAIADPALRAVLHDIACAIGVQGGTMGPQGASGPQGPQGEGTESPFTWTDAAHTDIRSLRAAATLIDPAAVGVNSFATGTTFVTAGDYTTIVGGLDNYADAEEGFSFIGGGGGNVIHGPGTDGGYSVIVGGLNNTIETGLANFIGAGLDNEMVADGVHLPDQSFIGSGQGNSITGIYNVIGGGQSNSISGEASGILSGSQNEIQTADWDFRVVRSAIGSGLQNIITSILSFIGSGETNQTNGRNAFIGAGQRNTIDGSFGFIGSGQDNSIATGTFYGSIDSGDGNSITGTAAAATIGGGTGNSTAAHNSAIGGGENNTIDAASLDATIAGGTGGTVTEAPSGFIGGGEGNSALSAHSSVVGGEGNTTDTSGHHSVVAGGQDNIVDAPHSFIGGGQDNNIVPDSQWCFVGGGRANTASAAFYATVCGGFENGASADWATVCGGRLNSATATHSTVTGGLRCIASGKYSDVHGYCASTTLQGETTRSAVCDLATWGVGSSQSGALNMLAQTSATGQTVELLFGDDGAQMFNLALNCTYAMTILVVATESGIGAANRSVSWLYHIICRNAAGTAQVVPAVPVAISTINAEDPLWTFTIDATGTRLRLRFANNASTAAVVRVGADLQWTMVLHN